jgi:hypothetical protein
LRRSFRPFASRLMDSAQRLAQRLDFAFVSEFLAFGHLDEFKHFLHLVECLFERLDNLCHLINRLADGGSRSFDFSFGQCRRVNRQIGLGNRFHSTRAASASAATAPPPSTARTSRRRGKIGSSLWFLRHACPSMPHHCAKAMVNCNYFFTNSASEAV